METSAEGTAKSRGSGAARGEVPVAGECGEPVAAGVAVEAAAVGAAGRRVPVAMAPASLSPSRASDFMQCPLLYRFRVIDRLPEKPSEAATRGTLVHAVLERLFDAPAADRTAPRAKSLIPGQWDRLRETRPEVVELFEDDPGGERLARWLGEAEQLVERWFTLEDPTRLEPVERELFVETELDSGLTLRGIIDRVDVAPTGEVRIVDYKTGKAPRPEYAEGALFQMKFYALVVWRLKNVVPRRLQLVYLGSGDVLTYDPVLADLERVERKLLALWEAIRKATESGEWRPRPTKLCGWCDHQSHCPEFGGTPPPYPLAVRGVGAEVGALPEAIAVPDATAGPGAGPEATAGPGAGPDATVAAEATIAPEVGAEPDAGAAPEPTVAADPTAGPGAGVRAARPVPVRVVGSEDGAQGRMGPD